MSAPIPLIQFRNTQLEATVAVLQAVEPSPLADALHKMLGGMPDFFNGDALILDFSALPHPPASVDWAGLNSLLRRFRLQPIGVIGLGEEHAAGARRIGLAELDAALTSAAPATPASMSAEKLANPAPAMRQEVEAEAALRQSAAPTSPTPSVAPTANGLETVFVDRMLRSGQQVYARDANLVIIGGVNAGAEILADGSIHCYGPLLGRAIAGAQGNEQARILATHFGPELVSIAGTFRTFEAGIPAEFGGRAVQVRLQGKEATLTIDPLPLS